ncbi:hypothetical protein ID866_3789 [Astraeus odoratus]|nr:hypothetical protein ID866_3789 [Astraeus odoratus]
MAKSLRSKTKRAFRAKKRESGVYAATEAARLHRLNAKLATTISKRTDDGDGTGEDQFEAQATLPGAMVLDEPAQKTPTSTSTHISTHGPRGSRREEWRKSKGMDAIPKRKGMNRQGGLAARRRAGRPSRRR